MLNEVRKFVRARKFVLYLALVVLIVALGTALPYLVGDGLQGSAGDIFSSFVSFAYLLVLLGATLFASYTIVSEFEERTALILFTRPIRKISVFLGKFAACFVLETVVMVAFYLVSAVIAWAATGDLVTSFLPSLGMCIAFVFASTGVGMLISSVFRKGGTSAVVTFIAILLVVPVISAALSAAGIDTWFMLDSASNSIATSIPEYVASSNQAMADLAGSLGIELDPGMLTVAADCVKSGLTMVAWGVAALVLSFLAFDRREF